MRVEQSQTHALVLQHASPARWDSSHGRSRSDARATASSSPVSERFTFPSAAPAGGKIYSPPKAALVVWPLGSPLRPSGLITQGLPLHTRMWFVSQRAPERVRGWQDHGAPPPCWISRVSSCSGGSPSATQDTQPVLAGDCPWGSAFGWMLLPGGLKHKGQFRKMWVCSCMLGWAPQFRPPLAQL